jgi:signal transduction histidine kinase
MDRIVLLFDHTENRRLLRRWLESRYEVLSGGGESELDAAFDLCILDGPMLDRVQARLSARRAAERPIMLPCLLVIPHDRANIVARRRWECVDDVITSPIAQEELRVRMELLLRARQLSLRAAEVDRLQVDVLNTVSHELRSPLAAIKGFTTTLISFFDRLTRDDQFDCLREIDGAADRMMELVDNLLDLARLQSGMVKIERSATALGDALEAAVAETRHRYPDRVISLELVPDLPLIRADPRRLRQVATNLIDNAVKYSPDGGEVEVCATALESDVLFKVTDHGIGIAPEHLEKVFDQFFRVSDLRTREIVGTGLGLAICRRIVEEHGGTIDVESAVGVGTAVTVRLPRE